MTWYNYSLFMFLSSTLWILSLAFAVILICWFGINYLPSADTMVHVY